MDYGRAFLLFSGFALPVFEGGGGGVDNVQLTTIIMLLPVSQQPGSASGVRRAAMPFGAVPGNCASAENHYTSTLKRHHSL